MLITWILSLLAAAGALVYVFMNYRQIKAMREGTPEMVEMSGIIRSGANTFMLTEYRTILIVVAVLAIVLSLFVEKTSGITFLIGAVMSSSVCILGMKSATYANVRTANRARETLSIGETVKVALCGGSISGLSVQAFGLMGLVLILVIWGGVNHIADGAGLITKLEGVNASIITISQSVPVNGKAAVVMTIRTSDMAGTVEDLLAVLRELPDVSSVRLNSMD